MYLVPRYVRICWYLCTRATSPPPKRTEGLLMKLLKKNKIKNNLNTELKEMGVFSAVAGNQLPNQLQKRGLPALFLQCPSQSHQRSARGGTRDSYIYQLSLVLATATVSFCFFGVISSIGLLSFWGWGDVALVHKLSLIHI